MSNNLLLVQIGHIETLFPEKFGVPRQSGLCSEAKGTIIIDREYSDPNAFRYLDTFSHIWVLWGFSEFYGKEWSPTVRPPKMGGNERAGVFATRSPVRPNPIALSCVKLESIEYTKTNTFLYVSGTDMVNGSPVYDIKPYVPYSDMIASAEPGISSDSEKCKKSVRFSCDAPRDLQKSLADILSQDPHPSYIKDKSRVYKMSYSGFTVSFSADEKEINVLEIE